MLCWFWKMWQYYNKILKIITFLVKFYHELYEFLNFETKMIQQCFCEYKHCNLYKKYQKNLFGSKFENSLILKILKLQKFCWCNEWLSIFFVKLNLNTCMRKGAIQIILDTPEGRGPRGSTRCHKDVFCF
jgi:hypothetical protein